jgi:hypothetical protein
VPAVPTPTPNDPTTPRGLLRLLINDTKLNDPVFEDGDLDALLAAEGDVVKLAAALALEIIAGDEALTSKVIRTQDLTTDGAKLAAQLIAQADRWREQADEGFFEVFDLPAPVTTPELTERNVLYGDDFWPLVP